MMKNTQHPSPGTLHLRTLIVATLLSSTVMATAVHADDVEMYRSEGPNVTTAAKPNLLFILDESGSMRNKDGDNTTRTEELQAALRRIFADPSNGGVTNAKAAFMGYTKRKYSGRRVITTGSPTGFFDVDTDRSTLVSKIDEIMAVSLTPTVQALAAGVQWFESGFTDDDGLTKAGKNTGKYDGCYEIKEDACPRITGADGDANDTTVITPVTEELSCAQNVIVLLTDGNPDVRNSNTERELLYYSDPNPFGHYNPSTNDYDGPWEYRGEPCLFPESFTDRDSQEDAACAKEIAGWAFTHDLFPDIQGNQNIVTHTVGFHTGSSERTYLQDIAARGGGSYFESGDTAALVSAFNTIISEAQTSIDYTFNAPEIPFDPANSAISGEYAYLPLLQPDVTASWKGNLKKYRISYDEQNKAINLKAQDYEDVVSSDPNGSGNLVFNDTMDYWNRGNSDGGDPLVGGVVGNMSGTRHLYTYLGSQTDLTNDDNRVRQSNSSITRSMLEAGDETERDELLYWINWLESDGTTGRQGEMGAPLHAKPIVVHYTSANDLVLLNTTEGILHAFDSVTGEEAWAFMPDELLGYIKAARDNAGSSVPMYGLDGPMTYYEIGSSKYVVFGMRRGGRNYYALNITNPDSPQFAWEIIGGVTTGFDNLGQTWSKPFFTKMKIGNAAVQDVLVFGGGYDTDQDDATARTDDDLGNSIFIVSPTTGALIREITSSDLVGGGMNNAIAADVLPVDINADGVTDRLYAADVGGRLIRIDTPDTALAQITGSNALSGTVVADVGGADGFQRFFNPPEAVYYNEGGTAYLALMIASGHRPKPLDTSVTDRIYMIKDPNIWTAPADGDANGYPDYPDPITEADLYNATDNLIQTGTDNTQVDANGNAIDTQSKLYAQQQLNNGSGWFINLGSGEKGFSRAVVYGGIALITTYQGERTGGGNPCVASTTRGTSRLYALNMTNGAAVFDVEDNEFVPDASTELITTSDRRVRINIPGMPPSPSLYVTPDTTDVIVGLDGIVPLQRKFLPLSWEEVIDD